MILRFIKIVLYNQIINKTRSTKNQENSAHRFGHNYLTNHLVKFLQDRIKPWRVGSLKVCTGYHFFQRKLLVRAFQLPLTFRLFMLTILIQAYCVNVVVDIKPIYLNKHYLFQNNIYYLEKISFCFAKICKTFQTYSL